MPTGSIVSVFASAVLPVLAIASVGYVFGRLRPIDVEPINAVTVYVLLPALVFDSLLSNPLGAAAVGLVAAIVLSGTFPNVGNFSIPIASFSFGEVGRTTAVVVVVVGDASPPRFTVLTMQV